MDNGSNSSFSLKQDSPTGSQPTPQANQQAYSQPQDMNQQVYGQPQQMNQQVYNQPQAPMGGGNGGLGNPPKTKKPMSGGKLAGIILGGVAVVAAIVCGVIFIPRLLKTDKEVVIDAFNAAFQSEVVEADTDDVLGSEEIEKKLHDNGGKVSAVFTVTEMGGVSGNATFNVSEIYNPIDKLVNYTISAAADGKDVFTCNLISEQDNTYIEFANMIDGYFMLPNNNIGGAISSSFIGELLREENVTIPDISIDPFADDYDEVSASASINSQYVSAFEKLWDETEYKKQGNAKIDVNGSTVKAKEYTVTVQEENIEEALVAAFDSASQTNPDALAESGLTAEQYEATVNQLKAMIPSFITGDFVLYVYIKDGKIVKCTSKDDTSLYGVRLGYDFYMDLDENNVAGMFTFKVMDESVGISFEVKDRKGSPNGKISVFVPDNYIDLTFTSTVENTDAAKTANVDMHLTHNNEELMIMNLKCEGNNADNSFSVNGTMTIPEGDYSAEFIMSGKFVDIVKGTSYGVVLDKIYFSTDGTIGINMNGRIDVDTTNNAAVAHDGSKKIYEVATLTQDAFLDIIKDNEQLINDYLTIWGSSGVINEEPESTEAESSNDNNLDGAKILKSGDAEVEILNSYAGTKCTYNDEHYISFADDSQDINIDYTLYEDYSANELVQNGFYQEAPSGDGDIDEIDVEKTLKDSSKVVYSYTKRENNGRSYVSAYIAKQIGEDCIAVTVFVYDEVISSDELIEILADANFKVK